jgi:hypothetical protein
VNDRAAEPALCDHAVEPGVYREHELERVGAADVFDFGALAADSIDEGRLPADVVGA